MTTLRQYYDSKQKENKEENDIKRKNTYTIPLNELYVEEGYNVRELDQAHIEEFKAAFLAGEYVPPLAVEVTANGVKIIDGHHRYHGALAANEAGGSVLRLECNDFIGSEADKIAFMITSSQGMPLKPLERAAAYMRLVNQGWEKEQIAKKVKRSVSDIAQHLDLISCSGFIQGLVRDGIISYALAVEINRKHGAFADTVARKLYDKAMKEADDNDKQAKPKITKKHVEPQFSIKKSRAAVELISDATPHEIDGKFYLEVRSQEALNELTGILNEYNGGNN